MAQLFNERMTNATWHVPPFKARASSDPDPLAGRVSAVYAYITGLLGEPAAPLCVADAACEDGQQCRLWAAYGHRVFGVDANAGKVALARERAFDADTEIVFDEASARALPWPDRSMDLVFAPAMLEQSAQWRACLEELTRVLRPGGVLSLAWPGSYRLRVQLARLGLASLEHVALSGVDADGRARRAAFALLRAVPPLRFSADLTRPAPCLLVFKAA